MSWLLSTVTVDVLLWLPSHNVTLTQAYNRSFKKEADRSLQNSGRNSSAVHMRLNEAALNATGPLSARR